MRLSFNRKKQPIPLCTTYTVLESLRPPVIIEHPPIRMSFNEWIKAMESAVVVYGAGNKPIKIAYIKSKVKN